jgi:sugar fermentation stimulation protein A
MQFSGQVNSFYWCDHLPQAGAPGTIHVINVERPTGQRTSIGFLGQVEALVKFGALVPATFVRRDNRFRVQAQVGERIEAAHLPNSGRLGELLTPGRKVWLAPADLQRNPQRRTAYDLALVEFAGRLVSVNARLPGELVDAALRQGRLSGFESYTTVRREVRLGESRLDFYLAAEPDQSPCWVEVKSVTLVTRGTARFPDAPTLRGQRHVRELARVVEQGARAAVVFVVQRDDATQLRPHDEADPAFGRALRHAARAGVEVHAWRCRVSQEEIQLSAAIPVRL